jgi:hypothetical protein
VITLLVSFGTPKNPPTKYITFDVVDMLCPYNALFRCGLLNTFKTALHLGYLFLNVLATFDLITTFSNEKKARIIECGFALGHKNVHLLSEDAEKHEPKQPSSKQEISAEFNRAIEVEGDFSGVALDPRVLDRTVCISSKMSPEE